MEIHISGRGVAVSTALRGQVKTKVSRVARFLPKITEVRVVLARERYRHLVEITLTAKRTTLHAEAAAVDFHSAVDLAVANLEQQARRHRDRVRARKPRPAREAGHAEPTAAAPPPADEGPGVVIRRLTTKPMSVEEALEQMRTRTDGVLVFTNARSRRVNVLHRRPDGQLELVQPGG